MRIGTQSCVRGRMQDRQLRSLRKIGPYNHIIVICRILVGTKNFTAPPHKDYFFKLVVPRRSFPLLRRFHHETLRRINFTSSCVGFTYDPTHLCKNSRLTTTISCGKRIEWRTCFFYRSVTQIARVVAREQDRVCESRAHTKIPPTKILATKFWPQNSGLRACASYCSPCMFANIAHQNTARIYMRAFANQQSVVRGMPRTGV